MLKKIKEFINRADEYFQILDKIVKRLTDEEKKSDQQKVLKLIQHQLGSINVDDISVKEMTSEERAEYLSRAAVAWKLIMEPKIKEFIRAQKDFMAQNADGDIQYAFSRGTINGLMLIKNSLEGEYNEHVERTKPKEEFDRNAVMEKLVVK